MTPGAVMIAALPSGDCYVTLLLVGRGPRCDVAVCGVRTRILAASLRLPTPRPSVPT